MLRKRDYPKWNLVEKGLVIKTNEALKLAEEIEMEYLINGKKLIWDFDNTESNASKLKDNNLFIDGIWNMKDTIGYTDTCVGLSILSDDSFYFVTFRGLGFTMRVNDGNVECIKKQITK